MTQNNHRFSTVQNLSLETLSLKLTGEGGVDPFGVFSNSKNVGEKWKKSRMRWRKYLTGVVLHNFYVNFFYF